jgi:hypothetical protein
MSLIGTKLPSGDVRAMSAIEGNPDIQRTAPTADIDPSLAQQRLFSAMC